MIGLAALAILVLSATVAPISATVHCAMRREISPCTCRREEPSTGAILVLCQRLSGYDQVARALTGKFGSDTKISLEVSFSRLPELGAQSFVDLGLSITKLKLNFNELRQVCLFTGSLFPRTRRPGDDLLRGLSQVVFEAVKLNDKTGAVFVLSTLLTHAAVLS